MGPAQRGLLPRERPASGGAVEVGLGQSERGLRMRGKQRVRCEEVDAVLDLILGRRQVGEPLRNFRGILTGVPIPIDGLQSTARP